MTSNHIISQYSVLKLVESCSLNALSFLKHNLNVYHLDKHIID